MNDDKWEASERRPAILTDDEVVDIMSVANGHGKTGDELNDFQQGLEYAVSSLLPVIEAYGKWRAFQKTEPRRVTPEWRTEHNQLLMEVGEAKRKAGL